MRMFSMSKTLSMITAGGVLMAVGGYLQIARLQAAPPAETKPPEARMQATGAPSRDLLDQYCVTCHNERLKTAGLELGTVDLRHVGTHAEVLEKVVRKLRSGQMPPEGRPRPDQAAIDAFVVALEASLDRAAASAPNPGHVASHRMNRVEYVNAIYDLLALEIDGAQLLPSDLAGFGFDNNANVLSITRSLMTRYIAAATKISRAAVGSLDNRPITQVYKVGFERRDARAGEGMPFGDPRRPGRASPFSSRRPVHLRDTPEAQRDGGNDRRRRRERARDRAARGPCADQAVPNRWQVSLDPIPGA